MKTTPEKRTPQELTPLGYGVNLIGGTIEVPLMGLPLFAAMDVHKWNTRPGTKPANFEPGVENFQQMLAHKAQTTGSDFGLPPEAPVAGLLLAGALLFADGMRRLHKVLP